MEKGREGAEGVEARLGQTGVECECVLNGMGEEAVRCVCMTS